METLAVNAALRHLPPQRNPGRERGRGLYGPRPQRSQGGFPRLCQKKWDGGTAALSPYLKSRFWLCFGRANNEFGARNFFRPFRELSSEQFRTDNFLGKICSRPVLQRCATYHVLRKIYGGCRILGPRKTCAGFARGAAPLSVGPSSGSHLGLPSVSDPHEGAIWGTLAESAREPPLLGR